MERKFNLAEAAKYIAGDSSPIPARRMRELARRITHVRVSKREWLFLQSDLDDFLARHRHLAKAALPAKPTRNLVKNGPKS
jgi:hypothetical protein